MKAKQRPIKKYAISLGDGSGDAELKEYEVIKMRDKLIAESNNNERKEKLMKFVRKSTILLAIVFLIAAFILVKGW